MRRWMLILLFSLGMTSFGLRTLAAPSRQIDPYPVVYTFGEKLILRARLDTEDAVVGVQAFLRSEGSSDIYTAIATFQNGEIIYEHDLTAESLRAFSTVEYWFSISPQSGTPYLSETYTFFYGDNRFEWQMLSTGALTIHWYEGDILFGQSILNAAQAGLERAARLLLLPPLQPVDIYVYATGMEMQSTLRLGGLRWIAGHADPDLGVAVVSLPAGPDQRSEIDRQIPHEVMHLLLYQATGPAYYSLPAWLKEGLASANEARPNPDYYVILSKAVEQDVLIPLTSLCQNFPQDNTVYLAYAQSDSFVRYLHQQYGQSGLQSLLDSYAAGQGCETASQSILGLGLTGLDGEWRTNALNDNVLGSALQSLLPWSALLLIVLFVPLLLVLTSLRKAPRPQPAQ